MDAALTRKLDKMIASELAGIVALRHDLHAHPQVSYQEKYAASRVQEALTRAGVPFQAGVAKTGVVGWIMPETAARRLASAVPLRADMDALPIQEETRLPYASQFPGLMHACGHDGNTAMLVGAATVLSRLRDRLPRPVKLLFQPAEEGGAGAAAMIRQGALDKTIGGVKAALAFALHAKGDIPLGTFGTRAGPFGARADQIQITITGRGCHAARPEFGADPIAAASAVVMNLHTVVSRNVPAVESAVVTIGQIHGGSKDNIIPEKVVMGGTVRTFKDSVTRTVHRRIREVVERTAAAMGCQGEFRLLEGYPVLANDPALTGLAMAVARQVVGDGNVIELPLSMGAEDFSFIAQKMPSCMLDIGMCPPGRKSYPGVHTPTFDFRDEALPLGIKLLCLLALGPEEAAR